MYYRQTDGTLGTYATRWCTYLLDGKTDVPPTNDLNERVGRGLLEASPTPFEDPPAPEIVPEPVLPPEAPVVDVQPEPAPPEEPAAPPPSPPPIVLVPPVPVRLPLRAQDFKATELKTIAARLGLDSTGTKAQLVRRINKGSNAEVAAVLADLGL